MPGLLDYDRTIAPPGYNRWLVPPAALAVHLSIGQAYAFSVFNKPLASIELADVPGTHWSPKQLFYVFSIAIAFLGISAALFGQWLERAGPRKAMVASAVCFSCGFFVSALGVHLRQLWMLYLGYGVLGGIGLGLGYISPVSTLIKWFADRPGLATGMAIMGFGGGAMVGSPLAVSLMHHFQTVQHVQTPAGVVDKITDPGVAPTMLVMGVLYGLFILFGAFLIRVPPKDWKPAGYAPPAKPNGMISSRSLNATEAIRTPQFYLLWVVLCTNVTAGIGILEQASPMIQDMFKGRLGAKTAAAAAAAGGFVGLLSLFNMVGRFAWSSTSDKIGRRPTFMIFFALGIVGYLFLPQTGHGRLNSLPLFVLTAGVLLSSTAAGSRPSPRTCATCSAPDTSVRSTGAC